MKTSKVESEKLLRYVNRFLTEYAPFVVTESKETLRSYGVSLDLYLLWLEEVKGFTETTVSAECFEAKMIEEWIAWLKKARKNTNDTCNVRLSNFRSFVFYLSKQDAKYRYLYADSKLVARQKRTKNKEEAMSRIAVQTLFETPNTKTISGRRYTLMMTLFYSAGVRIDELLSLTIERIHLDAGKPYIQVIGKGQKPRTLTLPSEPARLLQAYIELVFGDNTDPTAYVFFTNHKGSHEKMSQNAVRNQLKRYAEVAHQKCPEVPLNLHPHLFRRSKATHMLEDGANILQVSEFLGHENLVTTMHYLNITPEMKNRAMKTLESEEQQHEVKKWHSRKKQSLRDIAGTKAATK